VLAKTGDQTSTGETINSIDPSISINDNGRVAFVADVSGASGAGSALLADDGATATTLISFSNPSSIRTFAFPQINNAGQVAVRDRVSTLNDSFIRTWDSNNPGQFNVVAGTNEAAGDMFDSVTLPTLGNDGGVGFIGLTGGATQSHLYYNPSGVRFEDQAVLDVTGSGGLRPMISNEGTLVIRKGSGTTAEIVVLSASGAATIASAASGFVVLGAALAISDNGNLIAFAGDRGNGPGIFPGVLDASQTTLSMLITVAGETAAVGNHNELGYDAAGNPLFLSGFDLDSRIGLARQALGPVGLEGDSVVVSFIATPSAASRSNPAAAGPLLFSGQSGLWTVQVDFQNQLKAPNNLIAHVKSPIPVVQTGDSIAGQTVTGISIYDPIGAAATTAAGTPRTPRFGENRLAFLASTAGGSMVVRASQLDSDEDGLFDHRERAGGGIDMDQDRTIDLDLNAMGASVTQRDLFLEIDWLTPQTSGGSSPWKNEPPPGALQFVAGHFPVDSLGRN
jgi:hypothetical protein